MHKWCIMFHLKSQMLFDMTNFQIYDYIHRKFVFYSVALKITVDVLMKFHLADSTFSDNIFMLKHTKYIYLTECIVIEKTLIYMYQKDFTHYMHDKRNIEN